LGQPTWLGMGLTAVLCTAATVLVLGTGRGQGGFIASPGMAEAAAPRDAAVIEALLARVAVLEASLAPIGEAARLADARSKTVERQVAERGQQADRFLAAALLLQASVTTPRPWLREYQAMAELAPDGAISRTAAEVLLSHAARGIPTEAELRDRFVAMAPQLIARAPRQGDALDSTLSFVRGSFASVGLTAPPAPSDQEQAIASIAQHLRRGNLGAAVADAAALDPTLQPLLAGWLAQARARLAVEQAVQETLLRVLAPAQDSPSESPS